MSFTAVLQYRDARPGEGEAGEAAAGTKTCLDTTLISRRVARARTHARNANTNTKHDFPVGGVTKDSPPQPPMFNGFFLGVLGCIWGVFGGAKN